MTNNQIQPNEIFSERDYKLKTQQLRKEIVDRKKNRRIDVGPYVTLIF